MRLASLFLLFVLVAAAIVSVISDDSSQYRASYTDEAAKRRSNKCTSKKAESQLGLTITCPECELAILATRVLVSANITEQSVAKAVTFFCSVLKIQDKIVCQSIVNEFADLLFYLIANEALSPAFACGVLEYCPKQNFPGWNVTFPTPQPPPKPYPSVNPNDPRIYVLHVTDIHVDPLYTPGLATDCGEPICCRPPNPVGTPGHQAGKWGDYACDSPSILYENMLHFIANNFHNLSYAIFTGDMPPHDVWLDTRNSSLTVENYVMDTFHSILPNVKLFPAVGNHEAVPVNEFATRDITGYWDMSWLYNDLAQSWSMWLPEDAVQQVKFAGYYTTLTPDGVRIVSMNTNLGCNPQNWWLKIPSNQTADPDHQLHWLVDVLSAAEQNDELVYMIYHVSPTPGNCGANWWRNFVQICQRYRNTVIAHFAGHTHDDIFSVTYEPNTDNNNNQPFNALYATWFAGSVTPYQPENPGFRIFEIDLTTKAVVNYYQYAMNLTQANIDDEPVWYLEYTAKDDYNLPDMSPESWHQLSLRFGQNDALFEQYLQRRTKGNPDPCDAKCKKSEFCSLWVPPPGYTTDDVCGH